MPMGTVIPVDFKTRRWGAELEAERAATAADREAKRRDERVILELLLECDQARVPRRTLRNAMRAYCPDQPLVFTEFAAWFRATYMAPPARTQGAG
jgi:hypothetical protein